MERLIIPIIIFIVISQVIKALKKVAKEAQKELQDKQKTEPIIQPDIDLHEEIEALRAQEKIPKDNRPRLLMNSNPGTPRFEINTHDEEDFDEESPYKMDIGLPEETPKPEKVKPKQKKTPFISFAPKNIAQGVIMSEILKRPKY